MNLMDAQFFPQSGVPKRLGLSTSQGFRVIVTRCLLIADSIRPEDQHKGRKKACMFDTNRAVHGHDMLST